MCGLGIRIMFRNLCIPLGKLSISGIVTDRLLLCVTAPSEQYWYSIALSVCKRRSACSHAILSCFTSSIITVETLGFVTSNFIRLTIFNRVASMRRSNMCSVVDCTSVSSKSNTTTKRLCFNNGCAYAGAISSVLNATNRVVADAPPSARLSSPVPSPPSSSPSRVASGTATKCSSPLVLPSPSFICTTALLFSRVISACNSSIARLSSSSHVAHGAHRNDGAPPLERARKCSAASGSNASRDSQNPTIAISPPAPRNSSSSVSFAVRFAPAFASRASPSSFARGSSATPSSASHASLSPV
mmetsp:Transcript_5865/g.23167  ORF Transcript_5865/g.23167 Transcript_5865/m.23167 type:complete len:301 (-) Transcript_5865:120-1022(-)